jgi:hypothetical protein
LPCWFPRVHVAHLDAPMCPHPCERRRRAATHTAPRHRATPSRHRAPTTSQGSFPSSPGRVMVRSCSVEEQGGSPLWTVAAGEVRPSCHPLLGQIVEHLYVASKPRGVSLVHVGPHMVVAVDDPPDPVRPANHPSSRTFSCTAPCRSKSRRDPVRPATPAAR